MKIGHVIRRLRRAQGKTLQQLCDATGDRLQSGYLSRVERDEMAPSVYIAAEIAKALGVSVDHIIKLASGQEEDSHPSENRRLLPVVSWNDHETISGGYRANTSRVERWVCPPTNMPEEAFALDVVDTSMNSSDGLSFSMGGVIVIDPTKMPQPTDYVLAYSPAHKKALFRRLVTDGIDNFLSAQNSNYPMRTLTDEWLIIGVVTAQILDLRSNN